MKFSDQLKAARKKTKYSQQEVADAIGVTLKSYQYYEAGDRNPKYEKKVKLSAFLGTDLLTDVTDSQTNVLEDNAGSYLSQRRKIKNANNENSFAPFLPVTARAGYTTSYDQMQFMDTLEKFALPPGVTYLGSTWMWFEVEGDSMLPTMKSEDMILCSMVPREDWDNLRNFYTYVLITKADKQSDILIKRVYCESLDEWILLSDNDKYKPFKIEVKEIKEVWVFRRIVKKDAAIEKKFDIDKIRKSLK